MFLAVHLVRFVRELIATGAAEGKQLGVRVLVSVSVRQAQDRPVVNFGRQTPLVASAT